VRELYFVMFSECPRMLGDRVDRPCVAVAWDFLLKRRFDGEESKKNEGEWMKWTKSRLIVDDQST